MLSTLGAQRIAASQATRPALLPSLGNPHITEDSDSPRTGNFPPAAPEVPSLCPAGLQGPVSTGRSSREEKQTLFCRSNPSNETPPHLRALLQQEGDVHQQPTCRRAGLLRSGKASSNANEQEKLFPTARNRSEGGRSPRPKLPERGKRSRRVVTGTPQP